MTSTASPAPTTNLRTISANLRHIANVFASADTGDLPVPVTVSVRVYAYGLPCTEDGMATVDALAAVIGARASWSKDGDVHATYQAEDIAGCMRLAASAFLQRPMTREQELAAENERLRAELAAARAAAPVPATA